MSNELALASQSTFVPAAPVMEYVRGLTGHIQKSGLYLKGLSIEAIQIIILSGMELGLTPMKAIRSIHLVQGRPVMSADLMVALCKQSPICLFFMMIESTADKATYRTQRKGDPEPTTYSYLFEDAKRAGLTNKDNWKAHPAAMLRARCSAALARMVYPDLVMGLYDEDEGREIEEKSIKHVPPPTPLHSRSRPEIDADARKTFHPEEDEVTTREEALAADIANISTDHYASQKRVRQEIQESTASVRPGGIQRLFKLFNERFPQFNKQREEELRALKHATSKSERAKAMTSDEPLEMGEQAKKTFLDRLYEQMKAETDLAKLRALYRTAEEGIKNKLITDDELKIFGAECKLRADELKKVQAAFGPKLSPRIEAKLKEIEAAKNFTELENLRLFFAGFDLTPDEDKAVTAALSAAEQRLGL